MQEKNQLTLTDKELTYDSFVAFVIPKKDWINFQEERKKMIGKNLIDLPHITL